MAASVQDLTRKSGFVFEGTVRRAGAVTTRGIEPNPTTMVVSVNKVLKGPEVLSRYAGREITVTVGEHDAVDAGKRVVFFTNGLHYGEGLAVRATGHVDAAGPEVEREVHEAMKQANDDELLQHLRDAALVVSGTAVRVAPYEDRERRGSEHDPDWWEFVIEVQAIEKGTVKQEKGKPGKAHITAFFAHSMDVAWYRSPKVKVGDSGIFLLHEGEIRKRRTPGLALVHPLDFQPMPELERVRMLVRRVE